MFGYLFKTQYRITPGKGVTAAEVAALPVTPQDILGNQRSLAAASEGFRGFCFYGYYFDLKPGSTQIVMYR